VSLFCVFVWFHNGSAATEVVFFHFLVFFSSDEDDRAWCKPDTEVRHGSHNYSRHWPHASRSHNHVVRREKLCLPTQLRAHVPRWLLVYPTRYVVAWKFYLFFSVINHVFFLLFSFVFVCFFFFFFFFEFFFLFQTLETRLRQVLL